MMETALKLSIADDFSPYPSGRTDADGAYNGQKFREELLVPRLRRAVAEDTSLFVTLEGMRGFGSSFLEEAFGGLVRVDRFAKDVLARHLRIEAGWAGNERYRLAIQRYIEAAK